jgi:hypothetical protein
VEGITSLRKIAKRWVSYQASRARAGPGPPPPASASLLVTITMSKSAIALRSRSPSPTATSSTALLQDPASVGQLPAAEEKRRAHLSEVAHQTRALAADPRFARTPPSAWARAALLLFVAALFWTAARMRMQAPRAPAVEYASRCVRTLCPSEREADTRRRYSKEHQFRPAASPIITKTLADGRLRIHGAGPTHVHMLDRPRARE